MKTVFITGSSSGIGRACALYFQRKGWNVAATMRSPEKESILTGLTHTACLPLDVTDPGSIETAVRECLERFGSIDVLLNNAGFSLIGPFETTPPAEIERQYAVNVFGLMNVTRALLPHFREKGKGTVVNIASTGGRIGFPYYSLYNSTKFAVEGFSEALQFELRPFGIKVKIIEPGIIKTDFYGRSMSKTLHDDDGVYGPSAGPAISRLMSLERMGISAEKTVKAIYRAAASHGRKMRYSIGPDAKALFFMRRFLPFRLLQAVLRVLI